MNAGFHIAVFAKAPLAGSAKTRLIPLLGAEGAAMTQRTMTLHTLDTACSAAPGQVSLWAAGAPGHQFFAECAGRYRLTVYPQCEGALGQRMAQCLRTLLERHAAVLLIGTDCPVLSVDDLHVAAQCLHQGRRMVFIPAEDGGYVLVGAQSRMHPLQRDTVLTQAFSGIDWGTPRVMMQTRQQLAKLGWVAGADWSELPALWDVDTPEDYQRARNENLPRLST